MNLTEIFGIQNNIFGYSIDHFFFDFDEGNIKLIGINEESINYYVYPNNPLVKVIFNDNILGVSNLTFITTIYSSLPDTVEKFNEHCDKINDTFGNKNDESSYVLYTDKDSHEIYYYIVFKEKLSTICNITNCELCLISDLNYCIVCKDNNYTIFEDQKYPYGKLKICQAKMSDTITNEITEKTTEIEDRKSVV